MIHVDSQPEPGSFDGKVRQKGLAWLKKMQISLDQPLPPQTNIQPYWRDCLDEMHTSYNGCCAYLAVYFERVTGGGSVDHFIAKSRRVDLAYEWSNYRLACSKVNSRKREYEDVLDPFIVENGWFRLELLASGRIFPNPQLSNEDQQSVKATINRLGLDDPGNREMRLRHYQHYVDGSCTANFLKKYSPFVWMEASRQNLL